MDTNGRNAQSRPVKPKQLIFVLPLQKKDFFNLTILMNLW